MISISSLAIRRTGGRAFNPLIERFIDEAFMDMQIYMVCLPTSRLGTPSQEVLSLTSLPQVFWPESTSRISGHCSLVKHPPVLLISSQFEKEYSTTFCRRLCLPLTVVALRPDP